MASSPFLSSPLYTLTPHETTLLFQHYTSTTAPQRAHHTAVTTTAQQSPSPSPHNNTNGASLTRAQFTALFHDWLYQLRRKQLDTTDLTTTDTATQTDNNTTQLSGVYAAIDAVVAEAGEVAERLFVMLDVNGNERVEREEFKLFLACVDTVVGARIRAEWKRAVIIPRLKALAAL